MSPPLTRVSQTAQPPGPNQTQPDTEHQPRPAHRGCAGGAAVRGLALGGPPVRRARTWRAPEWAAAPPADQRRLPLRVPASSDRTGQFSRSVLPAALDCSLPGSPSFTLSRSLLRFMSTEAVTQSNHLTLGSPLLLLTPIFPSIRVFARVSALRIMWPSIGAGFIFTHCLCEME